MEAQKISTLLVGVQILSGVPKLNVLWASVVIALDWNPKETGSIPVEYTKVLREKLGFKSQSLTMWGIV